MQFFTPSLVVEQPQHNSGSRAGRLPKDPQYVPLPPGYKTGSLHRGAWIRIRGSGYENSDPDPTLS